ncbi:MAG: anhydro-N-acetylmuramic acid kinase [Streptococcaceae bacterium]|jgi:anhydro-N-acetylmuramic acid kinase|nr:anhydro-N-acetylmuramic acid kinase [Streptococcaceae bacterium]
MLAIGMMSGTSLDGIDVALVDFTNENTPEYNLIDFETYAYPSETITRIQKAMNIEKSNVALICQLNVELGKLYGQAAKKMMTKHALNSTDISFIANHGQTIYHLPYAEFPSTLQIGEPAEIFEATKVKIVSNFREADIAVGGQGAPIVPFTEFELYKSNQVNRIFVNIGGIANFTVLPKNATIDQVVAFDCGPGNMMIDAAMQIFFNQEYDKNGEIARTGQVNEEVLEQLMQHPYFQKQAPKSTGREEFGVQYVEEFFNKYDLTKEDWVATFTAFTAKSLAKELKKYANSHWEVIVAGGGSYNATLLERISEYSELTILTQEQFGYSSEAKEAVAMAILAKYTIKKQPNNTPNATGAKRNVVLGRITEF